jgi:hypothetical protein
MAVSKKKGVEKRPPYYLTTLMYQLVVITISKVGYRIISVNPIKRG